ncbi:hypothetical protein DFH06DRAFT_46762 [Mycena polygramma]|nr:hypothetical protein DFH06DRAFT_46762 [Mycena polygramma]
MACCANFLDPAHKYEQLRRLAIVFTSDMPTVTFECPALVTDLTLASFTITQSTQASIPWAQLTRYCENSCTWLASDGQVDERVRWHSYRRLSDVVDLCIQFSPLIGTRDREDPSILLPKLQHARFSYGRGLLQYFNMPILQSLSYDKFYYWDAEGAIPHLPRHLKVLRLRGNPTLNGGCFKDILVRCPELVEIFIDVPSITPQDLMATLIPSQDQPALGAKLEVLRVGGLEFGHEDSSDEQNYEHIQRMIRFRFQGCETLSRMRAFTLYDLCAPRAFRQKMDDISWEYMDYGWDVSVGRNSEQFFAKGHLCDCSPAA